jgi:pyruvate ferredoxin oxidoreductase alpha subunit
VVAPDNFTEAKFKQYRAAEDALDVIEDAGAKFKGAFGRDYPLVSPYKIEDAKAVIVAAGAVSGTVRKAVDILRGDGRKVGMLKIRTFRPFPRDRVREILKGVPNVGVLDKAVFPGAGGPIAQEVKASLYNTGGSNGTPPNVTGFVGGLGGRDITVSDIAGAFETITKGEAADEPVFLGLKKQRR